MQNNGSQSKPGLTKITNTSTPYELGGVFEASKFAKGDGWASAQEPEAERAVPPSASTKPAVSPT